MGEMDAFNSAGIGKEMNDFVVVKTHKKIIDYIDFLQKKTQFQLVNVIVRMSMFVIVGVGVTTTLLYMIALLSDSDTQMIGSTWSNIFGILLTNAFSIVGTIMGVKYASGKD